MSGKPYVLTEFFVTLDPEKLKNRIASMIKVVPNAVKLERKK
jgi:hypothetical protein